MLKKNFRVPNLLAFTLKKKNPRSCLKGVKYWRNQVSGRSSKLNICTFNKNFSVSIYNIRKILTRDEVRLIKLINLGRLLKTKV